MSARKRKPKASESGVQTRPHYDPKDPFPRLGDAWVKPWMGALRAYSKMPTDWITRGIGWLNQNARKEERRAALLKALEGPNAADWVARVSWANQVLIAHEASPDAPPVNKRSPIVVAFVLMALVSLEHDETAQRTDGKPKKPLKNTDAHCRFVVEYRKPLPKSVSDELVLECSRLAKPGESIADVLPRARKASEATS